MKNAFRKNIFRTIKNSMGRFLAIFAIIALGVGFFCGLKISKPAMVKTGRDYVTARKLYDYQLLSTWGFDDAEIEAIGEMDGVTAAEGAVQQDFILGKEDGTTSCVRALSVTETVNQLTLVAGRLPESSDECVLDSYYFDEEYIGQKVFVSKENDADTADAFRHAAYTVTGLVKSPVYLNSERGTTTIGSGKLNAFMILPLSGFSYEYYTQAYVLADTDALSFTDAYNAAIDDRTDSIETDTQTVLRARYDREISDADREIADAQEELQTETDKAKKELDDAYEELTEGQNELDDGKAELIDSREELADSEQELADAEAALEQAQAEYDSGLAEYEAGLSEYEDGLAEYQSGKKEYQSGRSQYQSGRSEYESGLAEYESGLSQYEAASAELEANRSLYNQAKEAKSALEKLYPSSVLARQSEYLALCETIETFESSEKTLKQTKSTLDASKKELDGAKATLNNTKKELEEAKTTLNASKKELEEAKATLDASKKELDRARADIEAGWAEYEDGQQQIEEGRQQIEEAELEIEENEAALNDGWAEYEDGMEELTTSTAEADKEIANAKKELSEVEEPSLYVLDRSTNVGYASYEGDVGIIDNISNVFPVFFFLIAALVCSTTMTRMVDDERTQIGTLRALGYSKGAIYFKYLLYAGIAATVGAVIGYFVGSRLFPMAIWAAYGMIYGFTAVHIVDDILLFLFSLGVSLLCSVGTTYLACRSVLKDVPADLIRPKAPSAGKRIFLERIPVFWNRLTFLYKVTVRNIFRFRRRMVMMILGIAGCTGLVLTGFGIRDSISNIANYEYDEIMTYDINASFINEITDDTLTDLSGQYGEEIENTTVLMETAVEAPYSKGAKSVTLMVCEGDTINGCVDFHRNGEEVALPGKGEILIDTRLSDALSLSVGDTITLQVDEKDMEPLTIAGIFENYIYYYAYVTRETYEEYFGQTYVPKSIYLSLDDEADPYSTATYLSDMEDSAYVTVVENSRIRVENMMTSMNYVVALVIACAAGLAFVVLFNLGNINISERVREIATLKVLGFYPRETGAYVFRENIILSVIGIICGLPLGILLHRFVMLQLRIDMASFEIRIAPFSYLLSIVAVVVFTVIVDFILRPKIEKIHMAESLKSTE